VAAADPVHRRWLLLLLGLDLFFIGLHLAYTYTPLLDRTAFDITRDRGFAEFFQYAKFLWLVVAFLAMRRLRPSHGYASWALLFGFLLLDDAIEIHEHGGRMLAASLSLSTAFGLRGADFGEATMAVAAATVLLFPILAGFLRGPPDYRELAGRLLILVAALGCCGVVVDMVHMMARGRPPLDTILLILEDGGEMAVLSVICATVHAAKLRFRAAPAPLPDAAVPHRSR